jgi:hypothetical protein
MVTLVLAGAWLAGVAFISNDTRQRGLPGWLRALWLLAALLPLVGLTAYVYVYFRPVPQNVLSHTGTYPRLRVTLPRAPNGVREVEGERQHTLPVMCTWPRHPCQPSGAPARRPRGACGWWW